MTKLSWPHTVLRDTTGIGISQCFSN